MHRPKLTLRKPASGSEAKARAASAETAWDDSLTDLSRYKLTPQEQARKRQTRSAKKSLPSPEQARRSLREAIEGANYQGFFDGSDDFDGASEADGERHDTTAPRSKIDYSAVVRMLKSPLTSTAGASGQQTYGGARAPSPSPADNDAPGGADADDANEPPQRALGGTTTTTTSRTDAAAGPDGGGGGAAVPAAASADGESEARTAAAQEENRQLLQHLQAVQAALLQLQSQHSTLKHEYKQFAADARAQLSRYQRQLHDLVMAVSAQPPAAAAAATAAAGKQPAAAGASSGAAGVSAKLLEPAPPPSAAAVSAVLSAPLPTMTPAAGAPQRVPAPVATTINTNATPTTAATSSALPPLPSFTTANAAASAPAAAACLDSLDLDSLPLPSFADHRKQAISSSLATGSNAFAIPPLPGMLSPAAAVGSSPSPAASPDVVGRALASSIFGGPVAQAPSPFSVYVTTAADPTPAGARPAADSPHLGGEARAAADDVIASAIASPSEFGLDSSIYGALGLRAALFAEPLGQQLGGGEGATPQPQAPPPRALGSRGSSAWSAPVMRPRGFGAEVTNMQAAAAAGGGGQPGKTGLVYDKPALPRSAYERPVPNLPASASSPAFAANAHTSLSLTAHTAAALLSRLPR